MPTQLSQRFSRTSIGMWSVVLLAMIMAAAGWFVYDLFETSEEELQSARARLTQLEERARITDETVTETGASASEQINLWESEIRRLEQQRKRNKSAIDANQVTL